jgi:RNA polymerase sigma factor (sigma-70 family)
MCCKSRDSLTSILVVSPKAQQFQEIYDAESDAVFRFCLLRTSDRELSLDLTQEAFMRYWNTLCRERQIKNSRAFLFTVARNLVIDWYRKKKSVSLDALFPEGGEDKSGLFSSGENEVEIGAEAGYLIREINALDEIYRDVVYLRYVEGLKPQEIGEVLEVSANVVSVRINRGIKILREKLHYGTSD